MTPRGRARQTGSLVLAPALLAAGCLDVADARAVRDLQIGRESTAGVEVAVDDGLAAVRRLAPGELHLWASAPTLSFTLRTDTPPFDGFAIRIENKLPEAELTATADGARLPMVPVTSAAPTERSWLVNVPANRAVRFQLRPPGDDADRREPFRFGVFADVQTAIDRVQDIYRFMNAEPGLRFIVMPGDQTQRGTTKELTRFQQELKGLRIPCFATLGNHELGTREDLFHDFFGRGNLHFTFRGVHFTLLDSGSATLAPAVYDWLDGWLVGAREDLHAVFMHIPPLDPIGVRNGGFASRIEGHTLVSRLARAGVDMTFYGHIHSFYAFENASIPAYVSGGGGALPERFDRIGRHFLAVDADPATRTFEVHVVRVDPGD